MGKIRNFKAADVKWYFRHLDLIREDIREEFELLDIDFKGKRICDFGCGIGLLTFGLALETTGTRCIGVDLFENDTGFDLQVINKHVDILKTACGENPVTWRKFPEAICELIEDARIPQFLKGNIVLGINLPGSIDRGYCKKLLTNLIGKEYQGMPTGEAALQSGLRNISRCLSSTGFLCAVEYNKDFSLAHHLKQSGFKVIKQVRLLRNEIRSHGRTNVQSTMALYLCSK
jgi:hypothetical protein